MQVDIYEEQKKSTYVYYVIHFPQKIIKRVMCVCKLVFYLSNNISISKYTSNQSIRMKIETRIYIDY